MNIIFICNEYPPAPHGGIGVFVKVLAESLIDLGVKTTVLGFDSSVSKDRTAKENGVNVIRLKIPYQESPIKIGRFNISPYPLKIRKYLSKRLERLIESEKFDLIESFDWSGPLWRKPSIPLLVRLHGANSAYRRYEGQKIGRLLYFLEKRNIKMADFICSVSNHMATLSKATFDIKIPIYTIPNFYNEEHFVPDLQTKRKHKNLLYVGRIHPRKGLIELVETFNIIANIDPEFTMDIIGDGDQGFLNDVKKKISSSAKDKVKFLGKIDHQLLVSYYQKAGSVIIPSRAEAFGLVAIEAMGTGNVVFMTKAGSGKEIIDHEQNGFLIDFEDQDSAANKIVKVLKDPEEIKRIRTEAGFSAQRKYSRDVIVKQNFKMYSEILASN